MADQALSLHVTPLRTLDGHGLDQVRAIYEDAFPARQRQPFDELIAEQSREPTALAFVALEDEVPLGFSFLSRLASVRHLFLTYFAVQAGHRGTGVGRAFWSGTREVLRREGETEPIVLEVEDPTEPGVSDSEVLARRRRIDFWRRVGAQVILEHGYEVPNLDGTGTEQMCLMRFAENPLASSELLPLVLALYREGYDLDDHHQLVRRARERWG